MKGWKVVVGHVTSSCMTDQVSKIVSDHVTTCYNIFCGETNVHDEMRRSALRIAFCGGVKVGVQVMSNSWVFWEGWVGGGCVSVVLVSWGEVVQCNLYHRPFR